MTFGLKRKQAADLRAAFAKAILEGINRDGGGRVGPDTLLAIPGATPASIRSFLAWLSANGFASSHGPAGHRPAGQSSKASTTVELTATGRTCLQQELARHEMSTPSASGKVSSKPARSEKAPRVSADLPRVRVRAPLEGMGVLSGRVEVVGTQKQVATVEELVALARGGNWLTMFELPLMIASPAPWLAGGLALIVSAGLTPEAGRRAWRAGRSPAGLGDVAKQGDKLLEGAGRGRLDAQVRKTLREAAVTALALHFIGWIKLSGRKANAETYGGYIPWLLAIAESARAEAEIADILEIAAACLPRKRNFQIVARRNARDLRRAIHPTLSGMQVGADPWKAARMLLADNSATPWAPSSLAELGVLAYLYRHPVSRARRDLPAALMGVLAGVGMDTPFREALQHIRSQVHPDAANGFLASALLAHAEGLVTKRDDWEAAIAAGGLVHPPVAVRAILTPVASFADWIQQPWLFSDGARRDIADRDLGEARAAAEQVDSWEALSPRFQHALTQARDRVAAARSLVALARRTADAPEDLLSWLLHHGGASVTPGDRLKWLLRVPVWGGDRLAFPPADTGCLEVLRENLCENRLLSRESFARLEARTDASSFVPGLATVDPQRFGPLATLVAESGALERERARAIVVSVLSGIAADLLPRTVAAAVMDVVIQLHLRSEPEVLAGLRRLWTEHCARLPAELASAVRGLWRQQAAADELAAQPWTEARDPEELVRLLKAQDPIRAVDWADAIAALTHSGHETHGAELANAASTAIAAVLATYTARSGPPPDFLLQAFDRAVPPREDSRAWLGGRWPEAVAALGRKPRGAGRGEGAS